MIVLMNQLIALMGDSYGRVMDNYTDEEVKSRARVILDLMDLYDNFLPNSLIYLHVCTPVSIPNGYMSCDRQVQ